MSVFLLEASSGSVVPAVAGGRVQVTTNAANEEQDSNQPEQQPSLIHKSTNNEKFPLLIQDYFSCIKNFRRKGGW